MTLKDAIERAEAKSLADSSRSMHISFFEALAECGAVSAMLNSTDPVMIRKGRMALAEYERERIWLLHFAAPASRPADSQEHGEVGTEYHA